MIPQKITKVPESKVLGVQDIKIYFEHPQKYNHNEAMNATKTLTIKALKKVKQVQERRGVMKLS